jgi:hypothetical protein
MAQPRNTSLIGQVKKEKKPKVKRRPVEIKKLASPGHWRIHGGKVTTSSGLAAAMKRSLSAWSP